MTDQTHLEVAIGRVACYQVYGKSPRTMGDFLTDPDLAVLTEAALATLVAEQTFPHSFWLGAER